MSRRAAAAAAALLAAALGGCSVKVSSGGKQLNIEKGEGLIKQQLGDQLGVPIDQVDCPERKINKGDTFECTASFDGQTLRLNVTQTDDQGYVEGEPLQALIDVPKASDAIASRFKAQTGVTARAACPNHRVLVQEVGSTFECTLALSDGSTERVIVTVKNLDGAVEFRIA